jgi:hypothetical protein
MAPLRKSQRKIVCFEALILQTDIVGNASEASRFTNFVLA